MRMHKKASGIIAIVTIQITEATKHEHVRGKNYDDDNSPEEKLAAWLGKNVRFAGASFDIDEDDNHENSKAIFIYKLTERKDSINFLNTATEVWGKDLLSVEIYFEPGKRLKEYGYDV